MKNIAFCLIAMLNFLFSTAQTVNTQFGPVTGSMNGAVYQFLGIPFAKPPVGNLRWTAPQNPDSWTVAINATSFAPVCPQTNFQQGGTTGTPEGNENCLYLNVWSPQITAGDRPVLVFIHGGGNQQGSASEEGGGTPLYFGKNMAARGNAVVVTIQYRLGPLGFLVHPGLEPENANNVSGNYAVLDQVLALNWVKNNIAAFGGNPNKVMVFGQSAGGLNVGNLLLTPLANGLFQKACMQSAVPVINSYSDSRTKGIAYVDTFVTTGTDVQKIAYMRTLPADSLTKFEEPPVSGGAVGLNWQPVVDNVVFSKFPQQAFQSGSFIKVPLLIGSNSEEMSLSAPSTVYPFMVTALIAATVPAPLRPQATVLYPPGSNTTEARQSYIALLTDAQFTSTTRRTAQCVSLNQSQPVWRYFFTQKHTVAALAALGSYHGMELFYEFNNWENATLGSGPLFHAPDDSMQKVMLNYWINFANTGNPNGTGLVAWPQYQNSADCYLELKATPVGNQCGIRTAQSNLWDAVSGFIPCTSTLPVKLTSFSVEVSSCKAVLKWQTADEQNIKEYMVEHSANGVDYEISGTVAARNEIGVVNYRFDFATDGGSHFFRLKMNEADGKYSYSSVRKVVGDCGASALNISPNPIKNKLVFAVTVAGADNAKISVINAAGLVVWSQTKALSSGENKVAIDAVSKLSGGIYVLQIISRNGLLSQQFLKQ